jgi:hypothetical protein
MKKSLIIILLISFSLSSQNKQIIKTAFLKHKSNTISSIAFENGYSNRQNLTLKVSFKSNSKGEIFDIKTEKTSKLFETELASIIHKIKKLNPDEYLHKGEEMKYEVKMRVKLSTKGALKRKIKKGVVGDIDYKELYIKEYFPVKWIKVGSKEKCDFVKLDRVPVTEKCKNISDESELSKCVSKEIRTHVIRRFDTNLVPEIGMAAGKHKILIHFTISKDGEVTNVEAEAGHNKLIEEGIRCINSFPNFSSPGFINGEAVNVHYTLPVTFNVE